MKNFIKQLKKYNPNLKEAEIEGILYFVKNTPDLTNNHLVRLTGLPKETLKNFKKSFSQYLKKPSEDKITLNFEGNKVLENMDLKPYKWALVEYEDKKLEKKLDEIRKKYDLKPKREYDQFFATAQTSVSKAKVLSDKGLVSGKNIALIGDDDLVSITLALLDSSFNQIVVFDIDEDILSAIGAISKELGINDVHTMSYDARNEFDGRYLGSFDVVVVDPPYTKSGVSLFVNRAIQLLKGASLDGRYIFLCYGSTFKSPEKFLAVQEIIQQYSLVIEDRIDKFNRYIGAESIGSASSLYIMRITKDTRALDNYTLNRIYTFDVFKDRKFPYVEHYTFKLFGVGSGILRSEKRLIGLAKDLCEKHSLKIEDILVTKIKPGFTITFILKNSNLILHTWVEHDALHIDLITCKPVHKNEDLLNTVRDLFGTDLVEMKRIG